MEMSKGGPRSTAVSNRVKRTEKLAEAVPLPLIIDSLDLRDVKPHPARCKVAPILSTLYD